MSTEWHFFAFNSQAFEEFVSRPLTQAVTTSDARKWADAVKKLADVHPPSQLTNYGVYGSKHPASTLSWYTGHADVVEGALPNPQTQSLDAYLKLLVESLSEFHLVGRCPKPSAVFSELRFPELLPTDAEQAQFRLWADALFWRTKEQPPGYEFLGRLNQQAGVVLPPELKELVAAEQRTGLFRRLSEEMKTSEWRHFAVDLKALMAFTELADTYGYALYYREDGT